MLYELKHFNPKKKLVLSGVFRVNNVYNLWDPNIVEFEYNHTEISTFILLTNRDISIRIVYLIILPMFWQCKKLQWDWLAINGYVTWRYE